MNTKKLNEKAFATSLALTSALSMFLLGILGNIGIYSSAAKMMEQWHMFFDLSFTGIITGMVEAGAVSFIFGWLIAYLYNILAGAQ